MTLEQRIKALAALGKRLRTIDNNEFNNLASRAASENPWFTEKNIRMAWQSVTDMLEENALRSWVSSYNLDDEGKTIAIVMAGNIPLVGFHDFLCVLICGDIVQIKLSSKDALLMRYFADTLIDTEPYFKNKIVFADKLKNFDAIIATGSDNTSRYFDYYFGKYPHIIRQNRTSCAVISGNETREELEALGTDIFSYFGLGCRNISKLFVPAEYDFALFFESLDPHRDVSYHHKYHNNYDYQKSIMLVNQTPFLDNGFLMLTQSEKIVSPIAVLYYEYYKDEQDLQAKINSISNKLQCIVGNVSPAWVPFGKAQYPGLRDYADNIDTLIFLNAL